ncbi:MAG TPA: hypothetical protein VGB93_06350 [Methylovirgula sp.]
MGFQARARDSGFNLAGFFGLFDGRHTRALLFGLASAARLRDSANAAKEALPPGDSPRPLDKAQRARARSSNYKSVNLGPQANAAYSEKPPHAPAKHRVNAIRMIKAGPIYEIKISHGTAKIKDLQANNA